MLSFTLTASHVLSVVVFSVKLMNEWSSWGLSHVTFSWKSPGADADTLTGSENQKNFIWPKVQNNEYIVNEK